MPDWDPTTLLFMNEEGPIPKLPPLETFTQCAKLPLTSISGIVSGFAKFCDFLISHLYTNYFVKMEDARYNRCRENLMGQKEMSRELYKKAKSGVVQTKRKRKQIAIRIGKWSERPEELFRLMAKFSTLEIIKDHFENMHKGFQTTLK